jgi:hypothetical protein
MQFPIYLDENRKSCGCNISVPCQCHLPSFNVTRAQLLSLNKLQLFLVCVRCVNDAVDRVMYKTLTREDFIELIMNGQESVTLTPFY